MNGPHDWKVGDRVKCKGRGYETTTGNNPFGTVGTVREPLDSKARVEFDYGRGEAWIMREDLDWISRPGAVPRQQTWKVRDRVRDREGEDRNGSITAHPNRRKVLVTFDGTSVVEEVERERLLWLRRPGQKKQRRPRVRRL